MYLIAVVNFVRAFVQKLQTLQKFFTKLPNAFFLVPFKQPIKKSLAIFASVLQIRKVSAVTYLGTLCISYQRMKN